MTTSTKVAVGLAVLCAFLVGLLVGISVRKDPSAEIASVIETYQKTAQAKAEAKQKAEALLLDQQVEESNRRTCRANMQSIANASQAWKVKNRSSDFSTLTLSDLAPDLGAIPICPDDGHYSVSTNGTVNDQGGVSTAIPTGSLGISCDHPGHNGFIPGLMSK